MAETVLGQTYRDRVTGFVGVAIGLTRWLNGVESVTLQAPAGAGGKVPAPISFDVPRLEAVPAPGVDQPRLGI